ncbi:hypothetical protein CR970_00480 [Candidatus Saccharibacteria bacterium]|nr:MAG: hypothetical protein CR970_00480 [Candidatus Saccharibacteria bacterium]
MQTEDRLLAEETTKISPFVPVYARDLVGVALAGMGIGLFVSVAYVMLRRFVFSAVMCRDGASINCGLAPDYAMSVALILGAIAGLIALVQLRVYRPLLVVLGAVISLWGLSVLVINLPWYWAMVLLALLFGAVYMLFMWIARIRSFAVAVVLTIMLIVAIRFVLVA